MAFGEAAHALGKSINFKILKYGLIFLNCYLWLSTTSFSTRLKYPAGIADPSEVLPNAA